MTDKETINVIIYSYKNKNLKSVVANLMNNTSNNFHVNIFDQHPLKRERLFADLDNYTYYHIFWDHIYTPIRNKADLSKDNEATYTLFLSDDVMVKPNWDIECIDFINNNSNTIISGQGRGTMVAKDKYMVTINREFAENFSLVNYVDRNFLFAKTEDINKISFPIHVKYYGEEEFLSLEFYTNGIDIYSLPSNSYEDLNVRSIENLYTPYSKEHFYNTFIDTINGGELYSGVKYLNASRSVSDFVNFHGIDKLNLKKIPYQYDDVLYDPYQLEFQDTGGERFVATTKAIY